VLETLTPSEYVQALAARGIVGDRQRLYSDILNTESELTQGAEEFGTLLQKR